MWLAPGTGRTSRSVSDRSERYHPSRLCVEVREVLTASLAFMVSPASFLATLPGRIARLNSVAGSGEILSVRVKAASRRRERSRVNPREGPYTESAGQCLCCHRHAGAAGWWERGLLVAQRLDRIQARRLPGGV